MPKADPLIRTKLRLPFTRPGLVPRPRLQARIAEGLHFPLTLVVAPAGFGKTTLVTASIAACPLRVAWLSLDRDDNQSGRFLTYLVAAVQGADPRLGREAAQLIAGMQQAPADAVLTSLINDLDASSEELVLVLDDYQFISSPEAHAQVAFLLEHCPSAFHLLIATRSDPPLPLARLRARAQMVELRTADLRFTPAEAAQFLSEVMGLRLDAAAVEVLEERTEGWVAGLQMAALSMRDRADVSGFIAGFSGTNRHILDYLLEEILAGQPPEIQRFLLHTSILERLTAPLCDALLANDGNPPDGDGSEAPHPASPAARPSASVLEYLERENLFVVALDDERTWFRYHQLFSDLLRASLQQAQPDRVPLLHERASAWLEQKGFIPAAIQHRLAAHEEAQAADLIERYGPAHWTESDLSVVQMADSLPPEILVSRPKIGLYQAWLLIIQGHITKALPLLLEMARSLAGADPKSDQHWIRMVAGLALAFLSPRPNAAEMLPLPDYQELDQIPTGEPILRDAADILYGMTLGRRGEIERAVEVALRCIQRAQAPLGTLAIPNLAPFLARLYLLQGQLHATAALCRKYLDPIKEQGLRFIFAAGSLNIVLGEALYEWNRLEEAEQQIRAGLQANEPWQNIMTDAFGLLALTRVLQARGDYPAAIQTVEKFEIRLQSQMRPYEFTEEFHTLRARVELAFGHLQTASEWAEQVQQSDNFQLHPNRYRLILAHIRLAQCHYAEVEKMLFNVKPLPAVVNQINRQIESDLLLAAAIAAQRRSGEAVAMIESCLALAEPEGYIRVFVDGGEPIRDLLAAVLNAPASGYKNYVSKILAAFTPSDGQAPPDFRQDGLVETLTRRELDVLRLLAQGCSNREIAAKLFLSEGTVKFYLHAILEKLGVHSRTQAILIARERNLA